MSRDFPYFFSDFSNLFLVFLLKKIKLYVIMYLSYLWNFGLRVTGHLKKARFMPFFTLYIIYACYEKIRRTVFNTIPRSDQTLYFRDLTRRDYRHVQYSKSKPVESHICRTF